MSSVRVWIGAIRPQTLTAGVAPVLVGSALAVADGVFSPGPALAALVGALLIQIGTNLFNDWADFVRGADGPDRLGPARATAQGWLTERQVLSACLLTFLAAIMVGGYLAWVGGWPIVVIGLLSIAAGLAYTGGPYPLAYVGLGDPFVLVFFGVVAVSGTYWLQAMTLTPAVLVASVCVGALATAILVVNNLRDRHSDARAGKRTLVVRFGALFARAEYVALLGAAYLLVVVAVVAGVAPIGWLLVLVTLPLAASELRAVRTTDGAALNRHLGGTGRLGLVFAVALSIGALL